jgi:hypothetical protein
MSLLAFASRLPALSKAWLRWQIARLHGALVARIPMRVIEALARLRWRSQYLLGSRTRWRGLGRAEIGRQVLKLSPREASRAASGHLLENLIDRRMYYARLFRQPEAWPDLQQIAATLAGHVKRVKAADPRRPVIVSPFHYVSQYANIHVVDVMRQLLGLASLAVVSGVPRDMYGDDHALIPGIEVLYTFDEDNRNGLGMRLVRSLKRNGVAVLFADVPPFALARYPMETVDVRMFGRPARIHNGVFRLGAPLDAVLLPFYLRFEHGCFEAVVFEPVPLAGPRARERVVQCIESALTDNYARWLPAGHPSLYFFAPSK